MNAAAVHLALNNYPPILNLVAMCLLVGGLSARNNAIIRTAFIVMLCAAAIVVPTYIAGRGAEKIVKGIQSVDVAAIDPHQEAATAALVFLLVEGVLALIALITGPRRALVIIILLVSALSTFLVFYTASLGGRIHHPETQMRHG